MQTQPKKTLYHGELRTNSEQGPINVKVLKGIQQSTKQKGKSYVDLEVDGQHRYYTPENDACLEFWRGVPEGTEMQILAHGGREEATLEMVGVPRSAPAPRPGPKTSGKPGPVPANPNQEQRVEGMEAGMVLKEAVTVVTQIGTDPFTPEFYRQVHFIASNLVRVSRMIRNGHLADKPAAPIAP